MGPPIALRLGRLDDTQLTTLIRAGRLEKGMPPSPMPLAQRRTLIAHLRELQREAELVPVRRLTARSPAARSPGS